jgi:hypothetical protein
MNFANRWGIEHKDIGDGKPRIRLYFGGDVVDLCRRCSAAFLDDVPLCELCAGFLDRCIDSYQIPRRAIDNFQNVGCLNEKASS